MALLAGVLRAGEMPEDAVVVRRTNERFCAGSLNECETVQGLESTLQS